MPGDRPLVVVADPIDPAAVARLAAGPCQVVDATAGAAALEPHLAHAWGLVVRSRTKVTRAMIAKAPSLQVIARAGVGVDNVDMAGATERRIRVVNAPAAATTSVAELTVGLLIDLARNVIGGTRSTAAGEWKRDLGIELSGKTVGFIGYGRIAREVARRLGPFGVDTIAFDPYVTSATDATEMVDLATVLGRSDFVSVHAASTSGNAHLMGAEQFAAMRKGAFLVNVARGALVDEAALLSALDSGHLGGAALDVFETEPPTGSKLLTHPRVIALPHIGASTKEGQSRAGEQVVDELLRALRGEPLQSLVNPEAAKAA